MELSFANDYIPLSQSWGEIISPNYQIKTRQIRLGIYTHTCYINNRLGVFVAGYVAPLKYLPKSINGTVFVPTFKTVVTNNRAFEAGLRIGDEILEYNERTINNEKHLTLLISRTKIGTMPTIKIYRQKSGYHDFAVFPEIKQANNYDYSFVYKLKNCDDIRKILASK